MAARMRAAEKLAKKGKPTIAMPPNASLEPEQQHEFENKVKEIRLKGKALGPDFKVRQPGVVYLGHIPHGFFEPQMKLFFSQFGKVRRLRLSRSLKTGKSKGYAFVEFQNEEVAKIVADTMNNYLMFEKLLKCQYMPPNEVHPMTFKAAGKKFKRPQSNAIAIGRHNRAKKRKLSVQRVLKSHKERLRKLEELGIDYSLEPSDHKTNVAGDKSLKRKVGTLLNDSHETPNKNAQKKARIELEPSPKVVIHKELESTPDRTRQRVSKKATTAKVDGTMVFQEKTVLHSVYPKKLPDTVKTPAKLRTVASVIPDATGLKIATPKDKGVRKSMVALSESNSSKLTKDTPRKTEIMKSPVATPKDKSVRKSMVALSESNSPKLTKDTPRKTEIMKSPVATPKDKSVRKSMVALSESNSSKLTKDTPRKTEIMKSPVATPKDKRLRKSMVALSESNSSKLTKDTPRKTEIMKSPVATPKDKRLRKSMVALSESNSSKLTKDTPRKTEITKSPVATPKDTPRKTEILKSPFATPKDTPRKTKVKKSPIPSPRQTRARTLRSSQASTQKKMVDDNEIMSPKVAKNAKTKINISTPANMRKKQVPSSARVSSRSASVRRKRSL
ncbi:hypothetical protein ScPMuIL_012265 [Solemya velum]